MGKAATDLDESAWRRKVPLRTMNGNLPDNEARRQGEDDETDEEDRETPEPLLHGMHG